MAKQQQQQLARVMDQASREFKPLSWLLLSEAGSSSSFMPGVKGHQLSVCALAKKKTFSYDPLWLCF